MTKSKNQAASARGLLLVTALLAGPTVVAAQDQTTPQEDAVRKAAKVYVQALQQGDAKALAASWTADGTYVDADGQSSKAADLIQQHFSTSQAAESRPDANLDDYTSSIRFVTPDVAIEEGRSQGSGPAFRFTATWVKKNQKWLLDNLREWHAASDTSGGTAKDNPLGELRWLLGEWLGEGQGLTVRSTGNWGENQRFIVRQIIVERGKTVLLRTKQRIAWDPSTRSVRSWAFDSDGGVVEGTWRREQDAWVVKTNGTHPDGARSSAVLMWVREGEDRCALKSSHVVVGETPMDDLVVEFTRQGAAPVSPGEPPQATGDAPPASTTDDEQSREQLLQSPEWRQLRKTFDEWLSVQKIYTEAEVKELQRGLEERIAAMSTSELQDFMHDTKDRLAVLMSDKAADARTYLDYFTMKGRKQKLAKLGDQSNVFDMTADQLREELQTFQKQRSSTAASNAAFQRSQTELSRRVMAEQRADLVSRTAEQRRGRAPQPMTAAGPYAPRQRVQQYSRPLITPWGGVGLRRGRGIY